MYGNGKENFSSELDAEGKETEFESRDARSYNALDQRATYRLGFA